jgi:hypothetical protein
MWRIVVGAVCTTGRAEKGGVTFFFERLRLVTPKDTALYIYISID